MSRVTGLGILVFAVAGLTACGSSSAGSSSESLATTTTVELMTSTSFTSTKEPSTTSTTAAEDPEPYVWPLANMDGWIGDAVEQAGVPVLDAQAADIGAPTPQAVDRLGFRVFSGFADEDLVTLQTAVTDAGFDKEITVVGRCPFSEAEFAVVSEFLVSRDWSDDAPGSRESLMFAPRPSEVGFIGYGHCALVFPVPNISAAEVERIRVVAVANNVLWVEFWAGVWASIEHDPFELPEGGLPHFVQPPPYTDEG